MFSYYPERLEERFLLAGTPTLFADLNTSGRSSWPSGFTVFQNAIYYSAFDDQHGRELWKYDGTSATRVTDIDPGPGTNPNVGPEELTVFDGALYFRAYQPATGMELWKYDGSSATLAADINPGNSGYGPFQNSRPQGLRVIGDRLYFSADDGVSGREIWSFDGTSATRLADLNPGNGDAEPFTDTFDFTEFDGAIYFSANPGDNINRLFRYDGQKIERVDRVVGGPYFNFMMDEGFLKVFDGALYFSGGVDGDNFDRELWKFDGTSISRAADIFPGPAGSHPRDLFVFNDALYFAASGDVNGEKLYKFDGTTASVAADVAPARSESGIDRDLGVLNGDLYYTNGGHLWRFDGANASAVADVDWNGNLAVLGSAVYLTGQFQPNGLEMARYDGNSISLAADMRAGTESSNPGNFSSFNDTLYFTADSNQSSHGEIWTSDGTGAHIADPSREYSLPTSLVTVNGQAYFAADNDGDVGYDLWRYDGDHSTKLLGDINGFNIYPPQLGAFGNDLLFWGYGSIGGGDGPTVIGLWAFDGTNARPIAPGLMANEDDPNSSSFTSFNGALYFRASEGYGGTMELWKFDGHSVVRAPGIAAGTLAIASGIKGYDGALYFSASEPPASSNYELWKYDGSQATLAAEIRAGADGSYPGGFEIHEGLLYFRANGDESGDQLWRYNSSTGVAERVTSNLATGPAILASLAGVLYIWTTPSPSGPVRLWSYDGVQATPVADFVNASSVFRFKGTLYFSADDGLHGYELWKLEPDVLAGDLNRDGQVSIADFISLAANFGKTNAGWSQGDLNYDGAVTVSDFIDLAANFGRSSVQPPAAAALAETVDDSASLKRGANRAIHHKNATQRHRHHRREHQKLGGRWLGR